MSKLRSILFFSAAIGPMFAFAQGGPPMVTDDPGTPGDGHWEINIAGISASTRMQDVLQAPYFDINYGWGSRIQLKLETGWVKVSSHLSGDESGSGTALLGVKYRFLDEDKSSIAVSTYPQIQFRHFFSSHDPEIAAPGDQYILPIEILKSFGAWELNLEVGYLDSTTVSNEFFYGVLIAFEKAKPWEPLAEVHVNTQLDGKGSTTLLNLGFRYSVLESVNIMGALGHSVTNSSEAFSELDAYLGVQLVL